MGDSLNADVAGALNTGMQVAWMNRRGVPLPAGTREPHIIIESLAELPDALAAGTGVTEVRIDRGTNVALHRRLGERVASAIST